jgi:glutathione S-transferase
VKLYVCWGTFKTPRPGGHPCANAHRALREAGWEPEVKKVYGYGLLPDFMNPTRAEVRQLTGQKWVPVLVTDDGETIVDSKRIVEWARAHPANAERRPSAGGDQPA